MAEGDTRQCVPGQAVRNLKFDFFGIKGKSLVPAGTMAYSARRRFIVHGGRCNGVAYINFHGLVDGARSTSYVLDEVRLERSKRFLHENIGLYVSAQG